MYISEVAPPNIRGALLTMEQGAIVLGVVIMYYIVSREILTASPIDTISPMGPDYSQAIGHSACRSACRWPHVCLRQEAISAADGFPIPRSNSCRLALFPPLLPEVVGNEGPRP